MLALNDTSFSRKDAAKLRELIRSTLPLSSPPRSAPSSLLTFPAGDSGWGPSSGSWGIGVRGAQARPGHNAVSVLRSCFRGRQREASVSFQLLLLYLTQGGMTQRATHIALLTVVHLRLAARQPRALLQPCGVATLLFLLRRPARPRPVNPVWVLPWDPRLLISCSSWPQSADRCS